MGCSSSLAALISLAVGCPSSPDSGRPAPGCGSCGITAEHAPAFDVALDAPVVTLAAGADVLLDWSLLDVDLAGRGMDPSSDVADLTLAVFHSLEPQAILEGLASDELPQYDVSLLASQVPAGTSCSLSGFEILGHVVIPHSDFVEGSGTWMVALNGGDGVGLRSLALAIPSEQATATSLVFDPQTASLEASVALGAATPLGVAPGPDVGVDWSGLDRDALGSDQGLALVDRVSLDRYGVPLDELPLSLMELQSLSEARWSGAPSDGQSVRLGDLMGSTSCPGLDREHSWLLSLWCDRCDLPIPRVVVVLELAG